jgi:hypothetical protein
MILQAHAQASMGGLFGLFTITIFIRISQFSIPNDLMRFLLRGVAMDPELVRTRFLSLSRHTTGDFVSSLFGSGLQFCIFLFLLVLGQPEGLVRTENYSVVTAATPALFNGGQMSCMMGKDMIGYGCIYLTV